MTYLGDLAEDQVLYVWFTTHAADGAAVAPSDAFESADFKVYKNGSATEKTTANGITVTSPFDAITGLHLAAIDTSVDTGDAGFWGPGNDYMLLLAPDTETVDSKAPLKAWQFSIENRGNSGFRRAVRGIVRGTVGSSATTTSIPTSSLDPAASATDQFKGRILIFDKDTATAALRGQATDITASTSGGTLTVTALSTAPASGDTFIIQ